MASEQAPYRHADRVVIRDIDISFGRWVMILLKVMLAAIPATILMWLIFFGLAVLAAFLSGGAVQMFRF